MRILSELSSSRNERTQNPNKALAAEILISKDDDAIEELRKILINPPNDNLLFDAIKVLQTIGDSNPKMIRHLINEFIPILDHKKNKIQWMCMSAISTISTFHSEVVYSNLTKIIKVMEQDSIIAKDKGFLIMTRLYAQSNYQGDLKALILEQLYKAPDNQFGQYVEKWMMVIESDDIKSLQDIIEQRLPELSRSSHQKRAIKKLSKLSKY